MGIISDVFDMLFGWMPPVVSAISIGLLCIVIILAVFAFISGVIKSLPFV